VKDFKTDMQGGQGSRGSTSLAGGGGEQHSRRGRACREEHMSSFFGLIIKERGGKRPHAQSGAGFSPPDKSRGGTTIYRSRTGEKGEELLTVLRSQYFRQPSLIDTGLT